MNKKDIKFDETIKVFYPPILYFMITVFVEVIAYVILFISRIRKINTNVSSFVASYSFIDELSKDVEKYSYLIVFISAFIGIFVFGYLYYKDCRIVKGFSVKEQFEFGNPKYIVIVVVFGFFASTGLSRFVSLLPLDDILGNYDTVSDSLLNGSLLLQIISVGIAVPIAEELIYRGLVFNRMKNSMDIKVAAVITSLLFGIFHFNLLQGVYAFLLSLLLIYCINFYNSIIPSIIIHSIANISAVLLSYFNVSDIFGNSIWVYILIMAVEFIIAALIFILCMVDNER